MPTRNVSLTHEQDGFVAALVECGEYQNASEAIRDGLRALQQRRRADTLRLKALRAELATGIAALERGDFVELEPEDVPAFVRGLAAAPRRRAAPKAAAKRPR